MIVHDLKNSIGPIELAVESVEENLNDRDYVMEMLGMIKDSAREGISFVMDILDYASNKNMDKGVVEARELFRQIEARMKNILSNAKVELKIDCPHENYFLADRAKIFRAISNLIKNAIESFVNKNITAPQITLSLTSEEENIYIKVADNGSGIPEEIAKTIFTPFVTSGKSGGTGLGLAIVKQIVEGHGGSMILDSSPAGTVFTIRLPWKE